MEQLFGEEHTTGLRDGNRGGSQVAAEETAELAFADFQALSEGRDITVIERASFDEL
jgi:hypothetical protein